ncbi:hypothetical protein J7J47_22995 [Halomonas sp. ISL-60]|uniref:hypothetical protein n=1 Tax=Halomonas sp. ISL-56 TaxID=2819149 RepID=UPI001BED0DBF|nr:hypothetical protein [Halomonas sp. ISL-56]MBT2775089.1 hypothetical protein [Halomonas sp. ISL-60]MBT2802474.1 hypothetical protein [Halomonas sp. ISL-56]
MANRVWIPALAAVALLLSACGDSQDDPTVTPDEDSAVMDEETARDEGAGEEEAPDAAENAAQMSSREEVEDDIEARQAAEEFERADALREDNIQSNGAVSSDSATAGGEEVEAGEDTLAANPEDVLDEEGAMPGEATRSDVDEIIAETERRFEEAEQRLEEQFQEVEQQAPSLEPMESEDVSPSWDTESSLPERTPLQDDREATDVDALIEDTERRFEEAQQRLEEQYQELENRGAESGAVVEPSGELGRGVESNEPSQESNASDESRSEE